MQLDRNSQAILLLCGQFSRAPEGAGEPLTEAEYRRVAEELHRHGAAPESLLDQGPQALGSWTDPKGKVTPGRLEYLLGRGAAMGLALEKWAAAGLWVLTRASAGYPPRLQKKLGAKRPPAYP